MSEAPASPDGWKGMAEHIQIAPRSWFGASRTRVRPLSRLSLELDKVYSAKDG